MNNKISVSVVLTFLQTQTKPNPKSIAVQNHTQPVQLNPAKLHNLLKTK